MTPELAAKYATPVPRHTSYPTAPQFSPAVDDAHYRRWLTAADPDAPLSLYLHIPFCDALCWFCGCHTRIVNRYGPIGGYLAVLGEEIDLVAEALGAPHPVSHVHFGGGSPNIVAPDDFRSLMDRLRRRFALAPGAEIAVEIDPRGMPVEGVDALARAGVTRASLGALRPMEDDGLVRITGLRHAEAASAAQAGRRIRVTEQGRPPVRAVCAVFDRYLETQGQRHSQAV